MRLRITERCATEDLKLGPEDSAEDAEQLCVRHDFIRQFVGKRSQAPATGENILNVSPYGHIKSLHAGRERGATIYDSEMDVCWLLAWGDSHKDGDHNDVYMHFETLSRRDELLPTTEDYEALETVTDKSLMDALRLTSDELLHEARKTPGTEVSTHLDLRHSGTADITVAIDLIVDQHDEAEQGWIAIVFPVEPLLRREQIFDLVADLIPKHTRMESLDYATDVHGRPVHYNEIALTWFN